MSTPSLSKAERRKAARQQVAVMRAEQERRERRTRLVVIGTLGTAIAALLGIFLAIWVPAAREQGRTNAPSPAADLSDVDAPSTARLDGSIAIGPDGALDVDASLTGVQVGLYMDYICTACGRFEPAHADLLESLVESGEITVMLHPLATLDRLSQGTLYSTRAASAVAYVADRAPQHTMRFSTLLLQEQPPEGSRGLTDEEIADLARRAGVDEETAAQIALGNAIDRFGRWVATATSLSSEQEHLRHPDGRFYTPTITLDGTRWNEDWREEGALESAITLARDR